MARPSAVTSAFLMTVGILIAVGCMALGDFGVGLSFLWLFMYLRSTLYLEKDGSLQHEGKKAQRFVMLSGAAIFPIALLEFLYRLVNGHFDKVSFFAAGVLLGPFIAAVSNRRKSALRLQDDTPHTDTPNRPDIEKFKHDEVGFTLPTEALRRAYIKWGMYSALGLVMPYAFGIVSIGVVLLAGAIAAIIGVMGYLYVSRQQNMYVYLSPAGIRGPSSPNSEMMYLGWGEKVVLRPSSTSIGAGVRIMTEDEHYSIFIPLAIAHSAAFREMLQKYSPDHALNRIEQAK